MRKWNSMHSYQYNLAEDIEIEQDKGWIFHSFSAYENGIVVLFYKEPEV